MENFESALKKFIVLWIERGVPLGRVANALEEKAILINRLPELKEYLNAIPSPPKNTDED